GVAVFDGPPGEGATAAGTSPEGKLSTALDGVLDACGRAVGAPPIPADLVIIVCRDGWVARNAPASSGSPTAAASPSTVAAQRPRRDCLVGALEACVDKARSSALSIAPQLRQRAAGSLARPPRSTSSTEVGRLGSRAEGSAGWRRRCASS